MLIECPRCEEKVDANTLYDGLTEHDRGQPPFKISLLQCPSCEKGILVGQECYAGADKPIRLWPEPYKGINWDLPETVRNSLDNAEKCYKANIYDACVVMCGRALESVCAKYKTKATVLAGGLKELLDREIIDKRIFEWGEMIKEYRNIGAHAISTKTRRPNKRVSKEEARDTCDFATAICDYLFVLTRKFEDFKKRKKSLRGRGKVKK